MRKALGEDSDDVATVREMLTHNTLTHQSARVASRAGSFSDFGAWVRMNQEPMDCVEAAYLP